MAPEAPTRRPYAAIGSASASSEEEESSSSGDQHEVANPYILAPVVQKGEGDDEEDDDDGGGPVGSANVTAKQGPSTQESQTLPEGNVASPKATKPSPMKRTAATAKLSEPSPSKTKKKKKAPAGVPSKSPPPEKPAAAGEDHHNKSPRMATPAKEVTGSPEKAATAKKAAKLPKKAVAAKKVAKPPALKKPAAAADRQVAGKEVAKPPLPSAAADVAAVAKQAPGKVAYNGEKHLEDKRETYWYLAETVKAMEKKHNVPGLYNAALLNIADGKAAVLEAKIRKQKMAELTLFLKRSDIEREVINTLSNSIK